MNIYATSRNSVRGVTLVESAIVIAVIGLLIGGVLKGFELISGAKVRGIAEQNSSMVVAVHSFRERFLSYPGDYVQAAQNIEGAGNGTGVGRVDINQSAMAFQHLAGAGFIQCGHCTADAPAAPSAENSPVNAYGGAAGLFTASGYYASFGGNQSAVFKFLTGSGIPSNILSLIDHKTDDGVANTGNFVFNKFSAENEEPFAEYCMSRGTLLESAGSLTMEATRYFVNEDPEANCGGSIKI